jgi:alkylhydroperoxidase family enzyme
VAWIKLQPDSEATGLLASIYAAGVRRAGKVFQILRIQSLNPPVLESSMEMYKRIMFGPSPLTRGQREMLAVVVSRANHCQY